RMDVGAGGFRRLFALFLAVIFTGWQAGGQIALADTAAALPGGSSLDFASANQQIKAPNTAPVQILSGGTKSTVAPGQLLTPAQYMAVSQVLQNGNQTLTLNAQGVATGGFATLTPQQVSAGLQSLVLPSSVSIAGLGFNNKTPLQVTGAATIGGGFYALQ